MSADPANILENRIELTEESSELILNSLSEGVCQIASDGRITYANESACRLLRKDRSFIIGISFDEVLYGKQTNTENEFCPIKFVLTEGEVSHVKTDTFLRENDERGFLVEFMCVPIIVEGELHGAVLSFQDITERRDVELAVAEARDSALESARIKANFLANMSHEIRTPLSGIVGTADLLLGANLDEQQTKYVETLKKSTDLLTEIVNDILDYSKIEAGKFEKEKVEFNPNEIATELIEFFKPLALRKDILLSKEPDDSIPRTLFGDVKSIRQILNNFLSNAIKFTESGFVKLSVAILKANNESVRVKMSVVDSGIGIDEEVTAQLFNPFTQADSSTTRKFGGTGLGLFISKQIAGILGGKVGFESKKGEGSTFWFECDFDVSHLDDIGVSVAPQATVSELDKAENSPTDIGKLKILVAEDNQTNREIVVEMLRQMGSTPKAVENGVQAVRECMEVDYDLVLMDLHMPELDGAEAAKLILENGKSRKQTKIIAFTASVVAKEREKVLNAGMIDILTKPFIKQDLQDILGRHFGCHKLPSNLDLQGNMLQHSLSNIIDPKMLQSLLEIEANKQTGFVVEILDIFVEHAEEKLAETGIAIADENYIAIGENAHNLKGSSSNVGIFSLSNLFAELEVETSNVNLNGIKEVFGKIENEFTKVRTIIKEK